MGASLLSFGLERGVEGYLPDKRKIPIIPLAKESGPIGSFLYPAGTSEAPQGVVVLGWYWSGTGGVEIGNAFLKKLGSGVVVQRLPLGWIV